MLVRTDTAVPSVLQPRFSVRYSWGRFDLTPRRIRPCSPLRAKSTLRLQRSSPRNETKRPVRLRYETRVPFQVPCSLPFVPGPHAPTRVSVPNANGTVPTERRLRFAHGSSTTSGAPLSPRPVARPAAHAGQTSIKRTSAGHRPNVNTTSTVRQRDINGTSTERQQSVNRTATGHQPDNRLPSRMALTETR